MEKCIPLNPADVKFQVGEDKRFQVKVELGGGKTQIYPAELSELVSVETLVTGKDGQQKVLLPEIF